MRLILKTDARPFNSAAYDAIYRAYRAKTKIKGRKFAARDLSRRIRNDCVTTSVKSLNQFALTENRDNRTY